MLKTIQNDQETPVPDNNKAVLLSNSEIINAAIQVFAKRIQEPDANVTVAEFIRLVQLQRELDGDRPTDITVIWKDPDEL